MYNDVSCCSVIFFSPDLLIAELRKREVGDIAKIMKVKK